MILSGEFHEAALRIPPRSLRCLREWLRHELVGRLLQHGWGRRGRGRTRRWQQHELPVVHTDARPTLPWARWSLLRLRRYRVLALQRDGDLHERLVASRATALPRGVSAMPGHPAGGRHPVLLDM